jgi:WD40 repeat protein/serine/threonine protein kinase
MNPYADRIESIFAAAVALPAQERPDHLDQACAGDADLRARVEALLRAHDRAGHPLDHPAVVGPQRTGTYAAPSEQPGTVIGGRYKLLEEIGEGGMGTVWVAEQVQPVRRKVAVKLIKPGMDTRNVLARFEAERQALALMDHPNIAKVFDGGITDDGRPFFVMELVKGLPLTEYCDARRMPVRDRLRLFVQICSAVQHAHQKAVIHRDLKPSNILVTEHDGNPVPKVIDFGLAKALNATNALTERTLHTAYGTVVGTPLYMAPEQVAINALEVDTRTDIYALGVILYELLAGSTPLEKARLKQAAWDEVTRLIREEEPPLPSTRLSSSASLPSLAASRQADPAHLSRLVRGELDWIVMKALEKDRNRRYDTPNGLAQDIERYMKDVPVLAGPPSPAYRLRKFVKRNKGLVLATAALVVALLTSIAGITWGLWEAQEYGRVADHQRLLAETAMQDAVEDRQYAVAARNEKAAQLARAESLVYDLQIREAYQHLKNDDLVACRLALDQCRPDLRGLEHGYLQKQLERKARILPVRERINSLALSANGKRLALLGDDTTIRVWDLDTGKIVGTLPGFLNETLWSECLVISGDGKRLVTADHHEARVKVFDVATGKEVLSLPVPAGKLLLSRDGRRLVLWQNPKIFVWDLEAGKEALTISLADSPGMRDLVLSGDGNRLFRSVGEDTINVWDLRTGKSIRTLRSGQKASCCLALSADDRWLFACNDDGSIDVWDVETGKGIRTLRGHSREVLALASDPAGHRLFSTEVANAGVIKEWDVTTGEEIHTLHGDNDTINALAMSQDGQRLVSLSAFKTVRVWDRASMDGRPVPGITGRVVSLALTSSGNRSYLGRGFETGSFLPGNPMKFNRAADGVIRTWDLEANKEVLTLGGHRGDVVCLALSADGMRLFSASDRRAQQFSVGMGRGEDAIKVWDLEANKEILSLPADAVSLCPANDRKRLVSASRDGVITIWDLVTGQKIRSMRAGLPEGRPANLNGGVPADLAKWLPLALHPDGRQLFTGGADKAIKVWDLETGKMIRSLSGHSGAILSLAQDRDGKRLYSGSADRTIKAWDLQTGETILTMQGGGGDVGCLALSADGKRLFSGGGFFFEDTNIRVWDVATGQELLKLPGGAWGGVAGLALCRDGTGLIGVGRDGSVKMWDFDLGKGSQAPPR